MLRYDLAELLRTPGMRQIYDLHEPPFADEDVEYVAPITGRVTVTKTIVPVLVTVTRPVIGATYSTSSSANGGSCRSYICRMPGVRSNSARS